MTNQNPATLSLSKKKLAFPYLAYFQGFKLDSGAGFKFNMFGLQEPSFLIITNMLTRKIVPISKIF